MRLNSVLPRSLAVWLGCWLLSLITLQAQVSISGEIRGYSGEQVYLAFYLGDETRLADSTQVTDGRFHFEREQRYPAGMYLLVLPPDNRHINIFLDEDQVFSLATQIDALQDSLQVSGSAENAAYAADVQAQSRALDDQESWKAALAETSDPQWREALQAQIQASRASVTARREALIAAHPDWLFVRFLAAMQVPEIPAAPAGAHEDWAFYYFKAHYFDQVDLADPALLRTPVVFEKVMPYLGHFTMLQADSVIVAVDRVLALAQGHPETFQFWLSRLLQNYLDSDWMSAEVVVMHLIERYYLSGEADWVEVDDLDELRAYVQARRTSVIGSQAADFTMRDAQDQPWRLHELEAQAIVLYFWSYDCPRCQEVTPQLATLMREYQAQGAELVSICINGDREIWKQKLAEYDLPGIRLADVARQSGFDQHYHLTSTPSIYVLDQAFTIRYKEVPLSNLAPILDFLLGEE